ncbi:hypothetical protein DFS34DRAFT_583889 [Phlyctochytrium arcticum]|nr:hypothetical protein DFS34DRAFT_583889 [Phlyctochytrium arcticum]
MPSAPAGAYTPTYSQQPYTPNYQVQPTAPFPQPQQHSYSSPHGSPSQIRKPPPVAIAPPAVTIRRSSSPSGSPSTARFYGVPPMPPPKSRAHSSSSDNLTAAGMQLTTSTLGNGPSTDFLSASQFGSSFMGMAGLKNLGNSCFMNSVIQCVGGTVPLARYFLDGSYRKHINRKNPLGTRGEVADSFAELVKTMWSGQEAVITPKKFKEIIGTHHPSFRGNEQQDSQEFLAFLLDSLHEDLNVARVGTIPPDKESDEDEENIPDEILLEKAWAKYRSRNWSIIVDLFQGILRNRLQCLTCGKTSTTFNPVMYFTLPIPERNQVGKKGGAVYLQECLDKYVEEEIMEGDNAWKCPRCKVLRRSTKQLTIARLPVILLVHLKRFYYQGPFRNRIDTYVEFPLGSLDLTRFVTQQRSNTHAASQEPFVYDLYGVSNHFGGLNGGHYTAQVKNGYKNNAWFNFDDSRISPADENSIKVNDLPRAYSPLFTYTWGFSQSPAAYILLYVRNMSGRRTQQDWWSGNARM